MSVFIDTDIRMEFYECWSCAVPFAMSDSFVYSARKKHKTFFCPNGCCLRFGESDEDKLKKQLARERAEHDQTRAEEKHQRRLRETSERRRSALKGQVTKIKNRVGKGACPCCNRFFKNLHRHMASKHPDYAGDGKPNA